MSDIQRNQWALVINAPTDKTIYEVFNDLEWYLIRECDNWFRIIHDKDIQEDGTPKTPHIHCIVELKSRVRFSTMLSRTSEYCKIPVKCISLQDIRNMPKIIQYLTHKNDKSKYQYEDDQVDTNNRDRYTYLVKSEDKVALTTEELFDIIDNSKNVRELVKAVGIDMYVKYGRVIEMLWKDKKENSRKNMYYEE